MCANVTCMQSSIPYPLTRPVHVHPKEAAHHPIFGINVVFSPTFHIYKKILVANYSINRLNFNNIHIISPYLKDWSTPCFRHPHKL